MFKNIRCSIFKDHETICQETYWFFFKFTFPKFWSMIVGPTTVIRDSVFWSARWIQFQPNTHLIHKSQIHFASRSTFPWFIRKIPNHTWSTMKIHNIFFFAHVQNINKTWIIFLSHNANKKCEKSWHRNYVWNYAECDENINWFFFEEFLH